MLELARNFTLYLQDHELTYVFLIILLYIIPRVLSRMGIPLGLGAFIVGFISANVLNIFTTDSVIPTFSLLGISSLFLYAGLEVNFNELKSNSRVLIQHTFVRVLMIALFIVLAIFILGLDFKVATILSLAIITPSTGFILDSLPGSNISEEQKMWVKLMAISSEMVALLLLVIIQANSPLNSILTIVAIIFLSISLPYLFQWVTKKVEINNPGSDFSFLLLLAVAIGTLTKKMGAYYLVGAFLVGFTVNFYKKNTINNSNEDFEKTARFFAAFFMPFYFFKAGLKLNPEVFSFTSVGFAIVILLIAFPIRIGAIALHRKLTKLSSLEKSLPIAVNLLPTLVFGLVMVEILEMNGEVNKDVLGALVIYILITTILPSIIMKFVLRKTNQNSLKLPSSPFEDVPNIDKI